MTVSFVIAIIVIAVATGMLTGLTGASGMSILITGLLLAGVEIRQIIALTFVVTFANGVSSAIPYARRNLVDRRLVVTGGLVAAAAIYPGYLISDAIPESLLRWTILCGLLMAGIKLLWKPKADDINSPRLVRYSIAKELLLGILFGMVMGILGGGGGIFIAVALIFAFKLPAKKAVGTSIVIMAIASIPGCVIHGLAGTVPWSIAAILIPISFSVAFGAARVGRRIPETIVKRGLGVYLVAIFFIMLIKEIS